MVFCKNLQDNIDVYFITIELNETIFPVHKIFFYNNLEIIQLYIYSMRIATFGGIRSSNFKMIK